MDGKIGRAGSLESCDVLITVFPHQPGAGLELRVNSLVEQQFGDQIRAVIENTLAENSITDAIIEVRDRGAFDYAIRARLLTALERAGLVKGASSQ